MKVAFVSLGCAKNLVNTEQMMALVRSAGHEITAQPEGADAAVLNTCGFIDSAKSEAIQNILELAELKKEGKLGKLLVTGCLSQRYQDELMEELPEVDGVMGTGSYTEIVPALEELMAGGTPHRFGDIDHTEEDGARIPATPSYTAYLKIAEGCDNRCSYCAIPLIRGPFRSRPMENIVAEAQRLAACGVTELNVVAQDTTRYGEDLYGRLALPELLEKLCRLDGVRWVRMLYCYPDRITDRLLDVMAREEKIVKYMDIPIQHVNGRILSLMNRRGDAGSLTALMEKIRARVPGVVLRTTLITGFPTETQGEFEELCEFVQRVRFERLGCFAYSAEEDTPAALMDGQLDEEEKRRRAQIIMEQQYGVMEGFNRSQIGRRLTVAVEGREGRLWYGRSYMDAPDIDSRVYFSGHGPYSPGDYIEVEIDGVEGYDLKGKALNK